MKVEAGVREVARREGSNGEGIGSAAHESSTQRTQEQEEEVAQGEGEEHQSTRVNTAGAVAEQEESGDEETRNEGGMQGRVQDGHAGSSAHERTAPRTPEGRTARSMQGVSEGGSMRTESESDMDMEMQYDMAAACEEEV